MDDQRTDRESFGIKRLLLALSIIPAVLLCACLSLIASRGLYMAYWNYNPEMAMFFAAGTMGFIFGVGVTVVVTQAIRRYNVRITHFGLRDLFMLMTMLAIVFGLMSYVLNKK